LSKAQVSETSFGLICSQRMYLAQEGNRDSLFQRPRSVLFVRNLRIESFLAAEQGFRDLVRSYLFATTLDNDGCEWGQCVSETSFGLICSQRRAGADSTVSDAMFQRPRSVLFVRNGAELPYYPASWVVSETSFGLICSQLPAMPVVKCSG